MRSFFHTLLFARLFWRRLPELFLGGFTIFLGTFFFTALSGILSSAEEFLQSESSTLMGGDMKISYFQPLTAQNIPALPEVFQDPALKKSEQMSFTAMLRNGDTPSVVQAKVVDNEYPLLGAIETLHGEAYLFPSPEEIWVSAELEMRLELQKGSKVLFGSAEFTVAGIFTALPDIENTNALFGGKVILSSAGFERSKIDRRTSRVDYTLLFTSPSKEKIKEVKDFIITKGIPESARIRLAQDEGGRMFKTFQSTQAFFLGFLSLLVVLFGGTFLLGVQHFFKKEQRHIALLKAFGMPTQKILFGYLGMMGVWCMGIGLLGSFIGQGVLYFLPQFFPEYAYVFAKSADLALFLPGVVLSLLFFGMVSLELFTPFVRLSPRTLLREGSVEEGGLRKGSWFLLGDGLKTLLLSLLWVFACALLFSGWEKILFFSIGGIGIVVGSLMIFALLQKWFSFLHDRIQSPFFLRILLSVFHRPQQGTRLAFLALFLAFFTLFTAGGFGKSIRTELSGSLQDNVPTLVFFDVQKEQISEIQNYAFSTVWYPMVRAYIEEWNEKIVRGNEEAYPQSQRAFNMTAKDSLDEGEEIREGSWWANGDIQVVSVEENFAKEMGIQLGDLLKFDVQGQKISATVKSIRNIGEDNFTPWFIFVFPPESFANIQASYLGFSWEEAQHIPFIQKEVTKKFPSVTSVGTHEFSSSITVIVEKILLLITVLTGFLLGAGILSFWAMILVNRENKKKMKRQFFRIGAKEWATQFFTMETVFFMTTPFLLAFFISTLALWIATLRVPFLPPFAIEWWIWGGFLGFLFLLGLGSFFRVFLFQK